MKTFSSRVPVFSGKGTNATRRLHRVKRAIPHGFAAFLATLGMTSADPLECDRAGHCSVVEFRNLVDSPDYKRSTMWTGEYMEMAQAIVKSVDNASA